MKRIAYILTITIILSLTACSGSPKTGGASADSGSHGSSGATDTSKSSGTTGSSAESTAGSDTSKNDKNTNAPMADTTKKKKP